MTKSVECKIMNELKAAHDDWLISRDHLLGGLYIDLANLDLMAKGIENVRNDVQKAIEFIKGGEQ